MMFMVFFMVLVICSVVSIFGSTVGLYLRMVALPQRFSVKDLSQHAVAFAVIVIIANFAIQVVIKHTNALTEFQVENFVKNNKEIQAKAGKIKSVSLVMTGGKVDSDVKVYEYSVIGDKTVYPIVNVIKGSNPPKIVLGCISDISNGYREVGKDPCKK